MSILSDIGPAAIAEAKIKAKLAEFLTAEQTLIKLQASTKSSVRRKAQELYTEHMKLDKERERALNAVEEVKQGFSFTATAIIIKFARDMEQHLKEVNNLQNEAKGTIPIEKDFKIPWVTVGLAFIAYKVIKIVL